MKWNCCDKDVDPKDLEAHIKRDHMTKLKDGRLT
jgi:hypothetical protein